MIIVKDRGVLWSTLESKVNSFPCIGLFSYGWIWICTLAFVDRGQASCIVSNVER
jgi:hypothetical protein